MRDARDVEQVVEQPRHLPHLPLDDAADVAQRGVVGQRQAQRRHAAADRRQRVAQLVGEHGQELVLAAVAVAQRLLERLALADVAGDRGGADDAAVLVADRRDGQRHVDDAAAAGDALRLERLDPLASPDALEDLELLVAAALGMIRLTDRPTTSSAA